MTGCGKTGPLLPSRPSSIRDAIAAGAAILETALASSSVENGNPGGILIPAEPGPWFQRRRYLLGNDKTIIGRGSDCEVRINHPNVSRHHLALEWIEGELVASHLSPLNPTLINGVPLSDARQLNAGDWVEIADGVRLRVELFEANDDVATERRAREERRLLAVLHADVVSYTRLVELDAAATSRQFARSLDLAREEISGAGGRIENVAGDSVLVLFNNAYAAVMSAINWQRRLRTLNETFAPERRMQFRIGVNSGDVLISPSGAVHGDAINIAARIQSRAAPGGVLVSGVVRDQLQGYDGFEFTHLPVGDLKNVSREVRVYNVAV
jgi:class 3 adenylate cyclase